MPPDADATANTNAVPGVTEAKKKAELKEGAKKGCNGRGSQQMSY